MELHQLRTFVTVAAEGHLGRAAERLSLSQPALSAHLKALEAEFGFLLFQRTTAGMQLTLQGAQLRAVAERVLAAVHETIATAQQLRGDIAAVVRLGTVSDPESLRLDALLALLRATNPALRIELTHGLSGAIRDQVERGVLDAGYFISEEPDVSLAAEILESLRFSVVGPAAWRDSIVGADWPALAALPWIGTPAPCSYHRMEQQLFARRGLRPSQTIIADSESAMHSLVRAGMGLGLMREDRAARAEAEGEIVCWPGATCAALLQLVYRRERADEPMLLALIAAHRALWSIESRDRIQDI